MATLGTNAVTLSDLKSRLDDNDQIATVIELLNDTNEVIEDVPWVEGNLLTGHKTTVRTGLPDVTWRKLNQGVPRGKSQTSQLTVSCGMMEAYSVVDKKLADLNNQSAAWRMSEDAAYIESMGQEFASTLFYGDTTNSPEEFLGLAPQYATGTTGVDTAGYNIINGDPSASGLDQTSIWLVGWGPNTVHGIYPKGSTGGLKVEDLGRDTLYDANNNEYEGYRTHYTWDCGIVVRDWRSVVRIANIDTSTWAADLPQKMIRACERAQRAPSNVKWNFYMHRSTASALREQMIADASSQLTFDTVEGKRVMRFDGIPVRRVESITKTESVVTGSFADF